MKEYLQTEKLTKLIAQKLKFYSSLPHEIAILVLVKDNKIEDYFMISKGKENSIQISFWYILRFLKRKKATKFILIHNHPNGDSLPSKQDLKFIEELSNFISSKGVTLLDSIILSQNNFCSLKLCSLKKELFVINN